MGDYINQSDLEQALSDKRLRALTDDDNAGTVDAAIVAKVIARAEGEVNSYVSKQYTTPMTGTIPEPLKSWSISLATLLLYQRRPPVPDNVTSDAAETRRQLREVASGMISLDIGSSSADESTGFEPEFQYEDRLFTRATFDGW